MTRSPELLPPYLEDVTRDTWDACRHSLLFSGRLLDFLAFTIPGARGAVDRVQMALDAVFDELHALPQSIPRGSGADRIWTRDELDQALDQLIEKQDWEHPATVLSRPRPTDSQLLTLCEVRLENTDSEVRNRLVEVRDKLERTVRIAEAARQKRERMATGPK